MIEVVFLEGFVSIGLRLEAYNTDQRWPKYGNILDGDETDKKRNGE